MLRARWFDSGRAPQCEPDPEYPNGIDIDASRGAPATCTVQLKYPAPRCGQYLITCDTCKQVVVVSTAGRPDDPKSVKLACLLDRVTRQ